MLAFARFLRVVSPSLELASANRGSLWSDSSSRDRNRLPDGQDVFRCVFVPVMLRRAFGTLPAPHIQRQLFHYMATATTSLRGRKEPVNLDHTSSVPLGFVGELPGDLVPSAIANRFREATVSHHVAHGQILQIDRLVLANDPGRCFVREIFSAIVNLRVELRYFAPGFSAIGRSFSLSGQSTLQPAEPRFVLRRVTRIADSCSIRKGHGAIDSKIYPHGSRCLRKLLDFLIQAQRHEVAARTVSTQCHGRRVRRELAAPLDLDRTELSDCQGASTSVPLETGSRIFSRLLSVFFLKRGVFGDFLEEVGKSALQVAKTLLHWNTRHLVKPLGSLGFFQLRQRRARCDVIDSLSSVPRIGSHPERPIVDVPHASKRLGQDLLLLNCWVKAKSVPELHLSQTSTLTCKVKNNP